MLTTGKKSEGIKELSMESVPEPVTGHIEELKKAELPLKAAKEAFS